MAMQPYWQCSHSDNAAIVGRVLLLSYLANLLPDIKAARIVLEAESKMSAVWLVPPAKGMARGLANRRSKQRMASRRSKQGMTGRPSKQGMTNRPSKQVDRASKQTEQASPGALAHSTPVYAASRLHRLSPHRKPRPLARANHTGSQPYSLLYDLLTGSNSVSSPALQY